MSKRRFVNIFWLFFGNFGLIILSVFSFFSFAFFLTPTELGLGTLAIVLCELVSSFYCSVFESPLVRKNAHSKKELSTVFWFGGLTSGLSILGIAAIYFIIDSESSVWKMLIFSTIAVVTSIFARPYIAKLRCKREFKTLALRTLWGKVIGAILGIACAYLGGGEWSLIIQLTAMNAVAFLILLATDEPLFNQKPCERTFVLICREGMPIGFRKLLSGLFGRGIVIILSIVATPAIIGFYSFGRRLVELPKQALLTGINSYAMPVFSGRTSNPVVLGHLFKELTICVFMLTLPVFVFMGIFGKEVITDIFGTKWSGAITFFIIFSLISGLQMIIAFTETLQAAFGKSNIGLKADIIKTFILLIFTYFIIEEFGILGVAVAIGLDFLCNLVIGYYAVYRLLKTVNVDFWTDALKVIIATTVTAAIASFAIEQLTPSLLFLIGISSASIIMQASMLFLFFGMWPKRILKLLTDSH